MINIDTETYKIKPKSYYKSRYKKNQIILAGSLRKGDNHIKRFTTKEYGKTKKWCTFSIARDGKIYQHYDSRYYTDFMGLKDIDMYSISIVLENMGMMFYDYESDGYHNWINEECDDELIYDRNWKNHRYWEKYSDEQYDSTVELCKHLCKKHKIPTYSLGFNVHDPITAEFKGVVTRSNFYNDYYDLNPSFDFERFVGDIALE